MNEGEKKLCEFQAGYMDQGSFFGLIFMALFKADRQNLYKLQQVFPEEANAVTRWAREDG